MKFFQMLMGVRGAKEFPSLTEFLVNNEAFRHMALKTHSTKTTWLGSIEKYLDKDLLGKEEPAKQTPI